MKDALFVVHALQDVVDVVELGSHSVRTFFCGGREELVVVIEV